MMDSAGVYKYVIFIGLIGGILGMVQKEELKKCKSSLKCKIFGLLFGCFSAMFAGYIGFEVAYFFFEKLGISIATAGVSGWAGTNALLVYEKRLISLVDKGKRGENNGEL